MSRDDSIRLDLTKMTVLYFIGEGCSKVVECKDLKDAIIKCQNIIDEVGEPEYGISLVGRLNSEKPKIPVGRILNKKPPTGKKLKELKNKLKLSTKTISNRLVAIYSELLKESKKKTKELEKNIKQQKENK